LGRAVFSAACLLGWGIALYAALQVGRLELHSEHGICGPWGCGPPPEALAACHLFWLVLLFPPALVIAARLAPRRVHKLGWALAGAAALGIAAVVVHEAITWLPDASDWQRRYFVQRCLFSLATLVEVPLPELLLVGIALAALSRGRATLRRMGSTMAARAQIRGS